MSENHRWPLVPLRELAKEMCLGKMLDKQKNRGTLQPYLRNINVRWFGFDLSDLKQMRFEPGEEIRYGLKEGDLIICEGGEPGRAAVWKGPNDGARIQKALHRIRFRPDQYDPSFAMYYLYFGTITNRFASYYTGTTIKHLTGKALAQVLIPVPPLNEHRRIVAKIEELFSDLDAGVAALERARANLKRYRASVLKSAVEGRLTAQWRKENPDVEPASELLKRLLAERRRRWEQEQLAKYEAQGKTPPKGWQDKYREPKPPDTENLPQLPENWCWATPDQLASAESYSLAIGPFGSNLKVSDYTDSGVPLVFVRHIRSGNFTGESSRFVSPQKACDLAAHSIQSGDVLITKMGDPPGDACLYPPDHPTAIITADCIKFRPSTLLSHPKYFVLAINSSVVHTQIMSITRGVAQKKVSLGRFSSIAIPLPPIDEQARIVEAFDACDSLATASMTSIEHNLKRAARLRQAILKRAFQGELVPQDPADEPARELLAQIRTRSQAQYTT